MRSTIINKLLDFNKKSNDVIFITADLGYGAFEPVFEAFGKRAINVGIAEQNMMLFASGLALNHKKVFCYSIATFPSLRCLEQIRNDACYHNLDVNILNVGTGVEYGSLGITHHSTEDVACLRAIPNMKVYTPSCKEEVALIMDELYSCGGPSYMRMNKGGATFNTPTNTTINLVEDHKSKIAIIASGTILQEAIDYNSENENKVDIYSLVNYFKNREMIANIMKQYKNIISLEEHQLTGGLYSYLCEIKNTYDIDTKIIPIAFNNEFTCVVGKQKELRKHYKIDKNAIKNVVENINKG